MYNNIPVYIVGATGKKKNVNLHFRNLPLNDEKDPLTRTIDDPLWDFKSGGARLGYTTVLNQVNTNLHDTVFLSRIPVRHSRQGLDNRTVMIHHLERDTEQGYSWGDILNRGPGLINTIRGNFDAPEVAFNLITENNKEWKSIPIHRKLVLVYDKVSPPYLIYRQEKIGYTEDGKNFKLAKHKSYLKEELVDMIGLKIA